MFYDTDADVEELEAALGVQITETWAAYRGREAIRDGRRLC